MRLLTAVAAGLVLLAQPAISQTYPSKPIHMLVPYAPGGITDIAARIVGAKLTEAWGSGACGSFRRHQVYRHVGGRWRGARWMAIRR